MSTSPPTKSKQSAPRKEGANPSETNAMLQTENGAISSDMKAMVQAEIRDQLDRERAILREAGSLALKIVGGAFALLLAIFTIFGLTTWKDVAKQTTDYMKQRVDALIQNSDSETGVRQTLNDLVNRAIVAAELTSLSHQAGKNLDLPKFEWDRLRAWLKTESLETQQFEDTLAILNAQSAERKKADANGFLSEMLNPTDTSAYRWIVRQPQKR
jgi:acyl transferase domain-containing protein